MQEIVHLIHDRLCSAFNGAEVVVKDESHLHAGHKEAGAGGHYKVTIVSDIFEGMSRLARHQKVLELFKNDIPFPIHALSIKALTRSELEESAP